MAGWNDETLTYSSRHAHETHERWGPRRFSAAFVADWVENQCGGCAFYVSLDGALGGDWGACTNAASPLDGQVMFEHDGCAAHEYSPPLTIEDLTSYRDALRTGLDRGFQASVRRQDRAELKRVEKLLAERDTAAQASTPPPPICPPE